MASFKRRRSEEGKEEERSKRREGRTDGNICPYPPAKAEDEKERKEGTGRGSRGGGRA